MPAPTGTCAAKSRVMLGAAALPSEPTAEQRRSGKQLTPEAEPAADAPEQRARHARGEARDRAQLSGRGDRDSEVVGDLREHR